MSERTYGGAPRTRRENNYGDTDPPEGSLSEIGPKKLMAKTGDIAVATVISSAMDSII